MLQALRSGLGRGFRSWGLLLGLWAVNVLVVLPLTFVLVESLHGSMGGGLVHDNLREGFDPSWYGEFGSEARGIETTFRPTVIGAGAFYDNLEAWLTGGLFENIRGVVGLGIVYAVVWCFLWGGVLTRFAWPDEKRGPNAFLQTGGRYFFRFLRLALLSAPLYYLIYKCWGWLRIWLEGVTRDVTSEKTILAIMLLVAALIGFLLTFVNICFAYAKIATVVENRRSMFLAALHGLGFVLSNPGRTLGLYYLIAVISFVLLLIYSVVAPGPSQSTALGILLALLVGQLFLIARLALRLSLFAGQTALYRPRP